MNAEKKESDYQTGLPRSSQEACRTLRLRPPLVLSLLALSLPKRSKETRGLQAFVCALWAGLVIFIVVAGTAAWSSPTVSNVVATQRTDGSGLVDVYYTLSGGAGPMMVALTVSNDNGAHWNVIPTPSTLSGSAGMGITNGANRHIIWDAKTDRAEVYWPQAKARVTASEIGQTVTFMLPGGVPLEMVRIPAGSFTMGSSVDPGWSQTDEAPVHTVTFAQDFYIGKYEVTQGQWWAVMGTNPASGRGVGPDYPVYSLSWNDVQSFVAAINALGIGAFHLTSEAEWEYACRGTTTTRFPFPGWENVVNDNVTTSDLGKYAWYNQNGENTFHAVGQKLPNTLGLYDMMGNVWEWNQDSYHSSYTGAPGDGSAWEMPSETNRIVRGGDSYNSPDQCRPANRDYNPRDLRQAFGFRLAKTP